MSATRAEVGSRKLEVGKNFWVLLALMATSYFLFPPSAFSATHVTGTYDLGASPSTMTTVNGTPEYGLIFVQRNKAVTYNGVHYGTQILDGYLDASGNLNDGAGNLWLDLVPSTTAIPSDSYYVVTVNIQGQVHSEIWVVPDVATVDASAVRQTQPAGSSTAAVYYQFVQQSGADLPQRRKLNLTGTGVSCADNAGGLSTDCTITAGSGSSAPVASATTSGTVKTDTTAADPVVYLKTTADSLLAGKVPTSRQISTSAPLAGGGLLANDLTLSIPAASATQNGYLASGDWSAFNSKENALTFSAPFARSVNTISCPSCEVTSNKNAANGYAGLNAAGRLSASQGQEVWSVTDLTDYASASGTGSTAIRSTVTSPATNDVLTWNGTNWINQAPSGGGGGITTLNPGSNTGPTVTLATGTSGTDFGISGGANTITFNLPNASASARGLLTSADWSTFNSKAAADLSNLSGPTAINLPTLTFAGAAGLTASGTNQNVSLIPSGTGQILMGSAAGNLSNLVNIDRTATDPGSTSNRGLYSRSGLAVTAADSSSYNTVGALLYGRIKGTSTKNITTSPFGLAGAWVFADSEAGATGTISNVIGTYTSAVNNSGTWTNYYGSYIAAPSGPGTIANKYALVTEPSAGNVGIATTSPSSLFSVGPTSQFQVDTSGNIVTSGYVNAVTGFRVNGGATNGNCLVGNGTNFVDAACPSSGGGASTADAFITIGHPSDLTGERNLAGTAGEIAVTDGGANGDVTVSLPATLATPKTVSGDWVFDSGTTPSEAAHISIAQPTSAGTRNSNWLTLTGTSFDTTGHNADWALVVSPTANGGTSNFLLQSRIDTGAYTTRATFSDSGALTMSGNIVAGGTLQAKSGTSYWGTFNTSAITTNRQWNAPDADGTLLIDSTAGSCTNQVVTAVNANAAPTCATVGASDVAISSPSSGQLSGVSSANLAAANKTIEKSIVIFSPATSDTNMVQLYFGQAVTLTRLACSTDTGTADINFDTRSESTPNTAGTNVLASNLSCTTTTGTTTSFSSAAVSADSPLNLQIASISGTPGVVRIHIRAGVN